MTSTTNRPAATLRDGAIKATIWKNANDKGTFYAVEFTRTYQDDQGGYKDSSSFSGSEPLKLAHLAAKAYDRINELRDISNGGSS